MISSIITPSKTRVTSTFPVWRRGIAMSVKQSYNVLSLLSSTQAWGGGGVGGGGGGVGVGGGGGGGGGRRQGGGGTGGLILAHLSWIIAFEIGAICRPAVQEGSLNKYVTVHKLQCN